MVDLSTGTISDRQWLPDLLRGRPARLSLDYRGRGRCVKWAGGLLLPTWNLECAGADRSRTVRFFPSRDLAILASLAVWCSELENGNWIMTLGAYAPHSRRSVCHSAHFGPSPDLTTKSQRRQVPATGFLDSWNPGFLSLHSTPGSSHPPIWNPKSRIPRVSRSMSRCLSGRMLTCVARRVGTRVCS